MMRQALAAVRRNTRIQRPRGLPALGEQTRAGDTTTSTRSGLCDERGTWKHLRTHFPSSSSRLFASGSMQTPLFGSMLVERIPVVVPDAPDWEREYQEWSQARRDKFKVKLPDSVVEPKGLEENLPDFEAAPRETEADRLGDRSTIYRKLQEFLFLVVKDKSDKWGFAKLKHEDGETMRQTAERSLKEFAGDSIECWVVGNAPQGHYEESDGTTFYYRGSYIEGDLKLENNYVDHAWVTKEELGEYFDEKHHELLKKML